ncbi:MAG: hypothetical protein ACD_75C00900G0002 [uncultured bacterium]|nr:MAG: hypothetical protein ACD_75C00900G0002 [uncultured bacterium]
MGVEADDGRVPVFHLGAEIFDLVCVDIGCCQFDGRRQIKDQLIFRSRLQDIHDRLTDFQGVVELRPGKALRRILVMKQRLRVFLLFLFEKFRPVHRKLGNLLPAHLEDRPPLQD